MNKFHIFPAVFSIIALLPSITAAECGLNKNANGEYEVGSYEDLMLIGIEDCGLDADYRIINDIDAIDSKTNYFKPIGGFCNAFTGSLHGGGHHITNLNIYNRNYQGLFCGNMDGLVDSLALDSAYVNGGYYTGAIVGYGGSGTIRNVYVTGSVVFGGTNSSESYIGGIAGAFGGTIENCYVNGKIGISHNVGGIVGENSGTVKNSYAINTKVSVTHLSGNVYFGAVVGVNTAEGVIENSYGVSYLKQQLIGADSGTVDTNSKIVNANDYEYYNGFREQSIFKGFDFENTWDMVDGKNPPVLRAFFKEVGIYALSYGVNYCSDTPVSEWVVIANPVNESYYEGKHKVVLIGDQVEVDVSGMHNSNQRGYKFYSIPHTMAYVPQEIKVTGLSVENKTYDGTTEATIVGLDSAKISGVCKDDEIKLNIKSAVAEFEDAEPGTKKKVKLTGIELEGDESVLENYTLVVPELSADIVALSSSSSSEEDSTSAKSSSSKKSSSSSAKSSSSKKTDSIIAQQTAKNAKNAPIMRFNGHFMQIERDGQRFDLIGNKIK